MFVALKPVKMRLYREKKGMSRQALSVAANVAAPIISKAEAGRYVPYDAELQRIAQVLGVADPADLMCPLDVSDDEEVEAK